MTANELLPVGGDGDREQLLLQGVKRLRGAVIEEVSRVMVERTHEKLGMAAEAVVRRVLARLGTLIAGGKELNEVSEKLQTIVENEANLYFSGGQKR